MSHGWGSLQCHPLLEQENLQAVERGEEFGSTNTSPPPTLCTHLQSETYYFSYLRYFISRGDTSCKEQPKTRFQWLLWIYEACPSVLLPAVPHPLVVAAGWGWGLGGGFCICFVSSSAFLLQAPLPNLP